MVAVCATGFASTARTPGWPPSRRSTTAFSEANWRPPTCRTVRSRSAAPCISACPREALHCSEKLFGFRLRVGFDTGGERTSDAVTNVPVENLQGECFEGGVDGADL